MSEDLAENFLKELKEILLGFTEMHRLVAQKVVELDQRVARLEARTDKP